MMCAMARREWPFAVLSGERGTVLDTVDSNEHLRGWMVFGSAGLGKTSLARAWLARGSGAAMWFGASEASRQVPFGLFAQLVDSAADHPLAELRAARHSIDQAGPDLRIVIDDAHLLDYTSAMFVHHLAEHSAASILVTARAGTHLPDAVNALWKDDHLRRVDLAPLSPTECLELCRAALGGEVDSATVARLFADAEGSPVYLRHLIEQGLRQGSLQCRAGVWKLVGAAPRGLRLDEMLESEIAALNSRTRSVLTFVAFGEPIPLDDLAALVEWEAIEDAEDSGDVRISKEGSRYLAHSAHPLIAERLRVRIGLTHARRIRGQIVRAGLARGETPPQDTSRIVTLALASDVDPPLDLLMIAAERAVALSDLVQGERFARAALARGGGFDAAVVLAHALSWQGKGVETEALLEDTVVSNEIELVRWGIPRVANRFWTLGDVEGAFSALEKVRAGLEDPVLLSTIRAMESAMALHLGDLSKSIAIAADVLARSDATSPAVVWAAGTLAIDFAFLGRGDDFASLADRAAEVTTGFDTGFISFSVVLGIVFGATLTGALDEANVRIEPYSARPDAAGNSAGIVALAEGALLLARGCAAESEEKISIACRLLRDKDATGWGVVADLMAAEAAALGGRAADANRALAIAEARWGRIHAVFEPRRELARSMVCAVKGETSAAVRHARQAVRLAFDGKQFALAAVALHTAVRFGDAPSAGRLAELAGRCDGPLPLTMAGHAEGLARHDPTLLMAASARFEELGFGVQAVDAAIDAAEELARRGDAEGEFGMRSRVNSLVASLGVIDTPALRRHRQPLPLTPREREVAALVGVGLTNRQIASELTVSVRTIEGHIYHVCTKLGFPNKGALASAKIDGYGGQVADYA